MTLRKINCFLSSTHPTRRYLDKRHQDGYILFHKFNFIIYIFQERKIKKKQDEALCNVKQEMPCNVTLPHQTSSPPAMLQHTPIPNPQTVTCTPVVTSPLQS